MRTVGAFEAKTHFSQLLAEVAGGETIVITKHGQETAMLIPVVHSDDSMQLTKNAIAALKKIRKGVSLGKDLSIREMRDEGKK